MRYIFTIFVVWYAAQAGACDFCMLGQGVNPYLTSNGRGLTLTQDHIESNKIYSGSSAVESHGKKESWTITSLTGFVSVNEWLTLQLTVPYTNKSNIDYDAGPGLNTGVTTEGIGDSFATARFTVLRHHNLDSTWIAGVLTGIKLPTGRTDLRDPSGDHVDRHAQPGTGSYDGIVGFSGSYAAAQGYQFTLDAVYNMANRGTRGHRPHQFGDSWNVSAKGFWRFAQSEAKDRNYFLFTGPVFEFTGKEHGTQTDTGYDESLKNDSTGGKVTYWSLGLYVSLSPSAVLNASLSKAIIHDMNYSANFDADPAENYKTNLALTFLF